MKFLKTIWLTIVEWKTLIFMVVLFAGFGWALTILGTQTQSAPKESTATINAYMDTVKDLAGDDEVRWKTVTKERFDPSKAQGEYTNDGMTERTITTLYYDDRVDPPKKKK